MTCTINLLRELTGVSKAIISNRIYLDNPGEMLTKSITTALTYKFAVAGKGTGTGTGKLVKNPMLETIKHYKILPKGILSIPQVREDLIPEGYEVIDKRILCSVPFPNPLYELYPEQQVVYDEVNDTCIINALVGWGKSFTALHIARKLGQKTLIITHTSALRDQWAESIQALFGMEAGIIGGGVVDYEDYPIVVGNTQSLVKHLDKISKTFGTLIVDEMHHCISPTFTSIIDTSHARYRIGLSGTLSRKDTKHTLFVNYFGTKVFKPPQSNTLTPMVKLIKTGVALNSKIPWTARITALVADVKYQEFIAGLARVHIDIGHSVLIIADRVEFLLNMQDRIGKDCVAITGSVGDRNEAKDQILSGEKKCIAGSRAIFSEGISIDKLSCVILAVPMNNDSLLEQIVGRIQRKYPDKLTPLVLDIQFKGIADKIQNISRVGVYLRNGWYIETVD